MAVELLLLALELEFCGDVAPEAEVGVRGVPEEDGRNVGENGFPPIPLPVVEDGDAVAPPPPLDPVVGADGDEAAGSVVGDSVGEVSSVPPLATVGRRLGGGGAAVVSSGVGATVGSLV